MTLLYFDVFSYPLSFKEILQFHRTPITDQKIIQTCLSDLVKKGLVEQREDFYQVSQQPEWLEQRKANNVRATTYLKKARTMTKLIAQFPFTRAVFVSGSLSKHVMAEDGDIDYFIITKPGRLWVTRTFLVLFKKIFLLNSHKYFCVNYFVDEQHLEIEEKNRFTATEVVTLLPMFHAELYHRFQQVNQWVKTYYPNFPLRPTTNTINSRSNWLKSSIEWCLSGKWGDRIDTFFMNKTIQYWDKKFNRLDPEQFAIALKSRRYVSKHHPRSFQHRVLKAFRERIAAFEKKHDIEIEFSDELF